MTPTYCSFHQHYTNGPCDGRRSINRRDLMVRIADIDAMLGDDEGSQSRGYTANRALRVERVHLAALLEVLR